MNVSRSSSLKIPKKIIVVTKSVNSIQDTVEVKKTIAKAVNNKFNKTNIQK